MIYWTDLLTVQDAIGVIRGAFDSAGRRHSKLPAEFVEAQYLKFEAVRFRFANKFMEARRHNGRQLADQIIDELHAGLRDLVDDPEFAAVTTDIRVAKRVKPRNVPYAPDLERVISGSLPSTLYEFTSDLQFSLGGGLLFDDVSDLDVPEHKTALQEASRLKSIVPEQKVSPVQFEILEGKLSVKAQTGKIMPGREEIVSIARDDIIRRGENLINELRNSNCDPRLLKNIEELQNTLIGSANPIQTGLSNNACDHLAKVFSAELPNATSALLLAHVSSVSMYLSQFPDWRAFSTASDVVDLSSVDIAALSQTLGQVAKTLTDQPDLSHPDVPKTITEIRNFLVDPKKSTKNAALAAARTLENLVIRIFGYGADYIDQSVKKTVERLATLTSRIVVVSLLSTALLAAANLSALEGSIGGIAWMRDAAQIVSRQIDLLKTGD